MAIAVDASSPAQVVSANNTTTTVTTATFSPPAGSVLVAIVDSNSSTASSVQTITCSNTGTALTWSTAVHADGAVTGQGTAISVLYAVNASAQTNITVTATVSDATNARHALRVLVLTGANTASPVGNTNRALYAGATASTSLTTSAGSLVAAGSVDWFTAGGPTGGTVANQTTFTNADVNGSTGYILGTSAGTTTASFTGYGAGSGGNVAAAEFTVASGASFSGSVALSGSGALAPAGKPAVAGSPALSGAGALAPTGKPALAGGVALSGGGALTFGPGLSGALAFTGAGGLTLTGVATLTTPHTVGIFHTPYVQRRMPVFPPLYALINFSLAVLRINGQWVEVEYPTEEQINAADLYFPGGHENPVDQGTAAILTAAGYTVDPIVVDITARVGAAIVGVSTVS